METLPAFCKVQKQVTIVTKTSIHPGGCRTGQLPQMLQVGAFHKHSAVFQQEIHINNCDACYFITNSTYMTCHNLRKWCQLVEHHLQKMQNIGTLQDNVSCLCLLLPNQQASQLRCFEMLAPKKSCKKTVLSCFFVFRILKCEPAEKDWDKAIPDAVQQKQSKT